VGGFLIAGLADGKYLLKLSRTWTCMAPSITHFSSHYAGQFNNRKDPQLLGVSRQIGINLPSPFHRRVQYFPATTRKLISSKINTISTNNESVMKAEAVGGASAKEVNGAK